ncbi:MAG TPA: formyltransferase [Gammaproteobacteria bacterium]|nr:formyltransferase [Gammaproteobacteria bacterium]
MTSAVVFAYHNVGARCLAVLLAQGVEVPLVVTHADDPDENVWFESVAALARLHDIPVVTPAADELPALAERVAACAPDFLFSFYYRHMLPASIFELPARGALNMHGSLLPKYRGRAPVNWAVLNGETETGASLHYMTVKPDAGALVDQSSVPILPNDTAKEVFDKVTCAAEMTLARALPSLLKGSAPQRPLDLTQGSYFGRRRPEDGTIDWTQPAETVHNLVRAVAPPYPGAFTTLAGRPLRVLRSYYRREPARHVDPLPSLYSEAGVLYADCRDGRRIRVLACELEGSPLTAADFESRYGAEPVCLGE